MDSVAPGRPLAGLCVVDPRSMLTGPFACQRPGDVGADVVKVAAPVGDEEVRAEGGLSSAEIDLHRRSGGMGRTEAWVRDAVVA